MRWYGFELISVFYSKGESDKLFQDYLDTFYSNVLESIKSGYYVKTIHLQKMTTETAT